jgi:hypothetical protein
MDKTSTPKTIVSRRTLLQGMALAGAAVPVLAALTPAQAGVPQTAVAYQPTPKDGRQCDGCALFIAPRACKSVAGDIAPEGWCKIWIKKPA